jgi:mono/diheme cytochrome c family protein
MFRPSRGMAALLAVALASVACYQKMADTPRYDPLEPSAFFADGSSARPLVSDTVARGHLGDDAALFTGKLGGKDVDQFPIPVTRDLIVRGQERFDVFCAPCHGPTGAGDGMIVQRGFTHPPSYHSDRLRQVAIGHFFDVMTNGFGAMPSYAAQVPVRDRWAIAAYIRALQLSQHATLDDVPPEARQQLGPS